MNRRVVFATIMTMLLISISQLALNIQQAKASGTIYIKADGSVDPPTAPISRVEDTIYTFTGNISETIIVQRSNVVIDGNGYTLQGLGSGRGFYADGISGITIRNVIVKGWEYSIMLDQSGDNDISNNTINNNWCGILLKWCSGDNISGNTLQNNTYGILLREQFTGYNVSGNTMSNNVGGIYLRNSSGSISGNTINNNIAYGIHFDTCYGKGGNNVSGNTIINNNLGGISLVGPSSGNSFFDNKIYNNGRNGIALWKFSGNNTISGNTINNNTRNGIYLWNSTANKVSSNIIQDNSWDGIDMAGGSSRNSISGNTINNNTRNGIAVWKPSLNNSISGNTIQNNNQNGIVLWESSCNIIYHNNIIDNSRQAVDTDPAANDWHHPDLLEGNYWSDYPGVDDGSGTGKHAIADDGIGDTHTPWPELDYDDYPLMHAWGSPIGRIYALIRDIRAMGLESRVERKLVTMLQRTIRLLDHRNKKAPARGLAVFLTKINVYDRLHKLTPAQANQLRTAAYEIIRLI